MERVALSAPSADAAAPESPILDASRVADLSDHLKLKDMFGIEGTVPESADKALKDIWDWAYSQASDKSYDSVAWEVSKLRSRIGAHGVNGESWSKVRAWVSANRDLRAAEDRMKAMEAPL